MLLYSRQTIPLSCRNDCSHSALVFIFNDWQQHVIPVLGAAVKAQRCSEDSLLAASPSSGCLCLSDVGMDDIQPVHIPEITDVPGLTNPDASMLLEVVRWCHRHIVRESLLLQLQVPCCTHTFFQALLAIEFQLAALFATLALMVQNLLQSQSVIWPVLLQ